MTRNEIVSTEILFDLNFGLNQLSGNRELLFKLLDKFIAEYSSAPERLKTQFEEGAWHDAVVLVHTLKGVAGNLGFVALHQQSKVVEHHLRQNESTPPDFDAFVETLDASFKAVELARSGETEDAGATAPKAATTSGSNNASQIALTQALSNHEFIPPEQLDAWLDTCIDDESTKQDIRLAIDELDYEEALSILEGIG